MADGLLNKASIILTPTGYKAGTLYNVAPVVEPYEDFDFARASVASRVNSSGLVEMVGRTLSSELVTNGTFDTDSDWTKETGWSIEDGKAIVTNTGTRSIYQNIGTPNTSKIYKVNYEILSTNGGNFKFSYGGVSGTIRNTTGIFTEYIQPTSSSDSNIYFDALNVFTGSIDNVSVKEIIDTNNIPRISYDSNGDNGHILLEPTSTNLVPYSEDFSDSSWTKSQLTESLSDITSPDGTQNAYKLTESNTSSKHQIFRSIASYTELTISFFAKKAERSFISVEKSSWGATVFNLNNGSVVSGTGSVVDFGNGWYRCSASYTASPAQSQFYILLMQDGSTSNYQGDGTSGLYLFGVQAEALSYPTSYIPTLTGSTVTRATETATGAGSATLINSTEGVLYAEIAALDDDDLNNRRISLAKDGDNKVNLVLPTVSNTIQGIVITGGVVQFNKSYVISNTQFNKIAIKYKVNDFALWINGVEVATDTSGNTFSSGELNELVFNNGNGNNPFYGKCKAVAVFNEALSDAELNNLTG